MPSILSNFEYDIFISYRHNDNRSGWVTEFVKALQEELAATIKEPVSVYFDSNPHDGLLETHNVDKSLEGKLKCLIFIPILSQTYCDPKSFAWQHEFCAFNKLSKEDQFGRDIKLSNGNVASRILPIKIHDLDAEDKATIESEIGGVLRAIDFIYKEPGVNRPLKSTDSKTDNQNKTDYRNQVNKVANAIKGVISSIKNPTSQKTSTTSYQPTTPSPKPTIKFILAGAIVLLFLIAGYFLYPKILSSPRQEGGIEKSIAVLPFANMSSDPDQEYFSDGLTEDIITQLAKIRSIKVISRTSVIQYKKNAKSLKEIGDELGVAVILEGSVQRSGDQVRITAQLIKADTDEHLWAESYDRPLTDIFTIQREVATSIATILKATLSVGESNQLNQAVTTDPQAYNLYLRGYFELVDSKDRSSIREARKYFEQAIQLDSTFAKAYFSLADCYLNESGFGYEDPKIVLPMARKYIDKGMQFGSATSEAYASLGGWHRNTFNFRESEKMLRKAIEVNPSQDNAYGWLANMLEMTGQYEESLGIFKKYFEVSPRALYSSDLRGYYNRLLVAMNFEEGIRAIRQQLESTSNYPEFQKDIYNQLARYYWYGGKRNEAISAAEHADNKALVRYYKEGKNDWLIKEIKNRIKEKSEAGDYVSPVGLLLSYTIAGEYQEAYKWFEIAFEKKEPRLVLLLLHSSARMFPQNDPGYNQMREKIISLIDYDWPQN